MAPATAHNGGTLTDTAAGARTPQDLDRVVIRFAGDSGDGMQLTGDRFTTVSAIFGNDLSTLPDFPAEIRAPAGTLAGVSAFQVHISDHDILTPGDYPNVLVAMNPAALRANITDLPMGATIILNSDAFDDRSLAKAGYSANPLEDGTLAGYSIYEVPMTSLTLEATKPTGAKPRDAERSKNFFALGLVTWLYHRPVQETLDWIVERFSRSPMVADSNTLAFKAGYNFGETAELFQVTYQVKPASTILHELSRHKNFGVRTLQAEDEIAGVSMALGAAFGGHLGITTTSGPGIDLKSETVGLAVSLELPLIIVDIQRAGPSTGMPTKTEQADLLHVMYGRHGEAPVPVVAAMTPGHSFWAAIEAVRIAIKYRTPVYLLSDGYLANSAEPWRLPDASALPDIAVPFATEANGTDADGRPVFLPYLRDEETLARAWAVPGTPGLEHRIGGIEKEDGSGNISYDPANHERMVRLRAAKIAGIAKDIPPVEVDGEDGAEVLVLGWGSTYGTIKAAVRRVRARGRKVAQAHLVHLNPFPANLGEVLRSYRAVLVPEINLGHLSKLVRAEFLVDARALTKVQGQPFRVAEVETAIMEAIDV